MSSKSNIPKRNLFEIENARNLSPQELVETFVPTQSFWRLLSAKHQVILGSRGSGKTALAKMLSHDHMSLLREQRAQATIHSKAFIGVYAPTRLEWVGGLKNKPWQTEAEKELFFQWRLNLSSCLALLTTIKSCIQAYCGNMGQQARAERELSLLLSEAWIDDKKIETIEGIKRHLEDIEYAKHQEIARSRAAGSEHLHANPIGTAFDTDLFVPMRRGITLATRVIGLSEACSWLICLDEAEFLEELHHRILNSHMRAYSGNVFFKLTTMPYCHYTLQTNTGVSLDVGHDFDYVYIDSDPVLYERALGESATIGTQFPRKLFARRVEASGMFMDKRDGEPFTIENLLGPSELLDEKNDEWTVSSPSFNLLRKYCSADTITRAERKIGTPEFLPQISRKLHGALLLRDAHENMVGNADTNIYSGTALVIRCGDANPRRLIRIYNALILSIWKKARRAGPSPKIDPKDQSRIMRRLSTSALARVQSEPKCGSDLYNFLNEIGSYMHSFFHDRPLTTDQVSSIIIDKEISDEHWNFIRRAVELGLLYPNIGMHARNEMPNKEGTFHFAFILAPHFFLLPRRGKARSLYSIFNDIRNDGRQKTLF